MSFDDFDDDSDAEFEQAITSSDVMVRARALAARGAEMLRTHSEVHLAVIYLEEAWEVFCARNEIGEAANYAVAYGNALCHEKNYAKAEEVYLAGADFAKQTLDTGNEILCLANIGLVSRRQKNFEKASEYYGLARKLAVETSHWMVAHLSNEYARALRKIGAFDEAADVLREGVADARVSGDDFPMVMHDQELAVVLMEQGKYEEALAVATEAFALAEYVENIREMQRSQFNKARALNLLGRYEAALVELAALGERKEFQFKLKHRMRVDFELAKAQAGLGFWDEAGALLRKLVPLFESVLLRKEAQAARYQIILNHMVMGNSLDAEQVCAEFMERKEFASKDDLRGVIETMASIYRDRADWAGVISSLEQLLEDPVNQFADWFPSVLQRLGVAYFKVGRIDEARASVASLVAAKNSRLPLGDAYSVMAGLAELDGDWSLARRFGRKAIKAYLAAGQGYKAEDLAKYL